MKKALIIGGILTFSTVAFSQTTKAEETPARQENIKPAPTHEIVLMKAAPRTTKVKPVAAKQCIPKNEGPYKLQREETGLTESNKKK